MSALHVEAVGPLALTEDLGRPGHASIGVTTSGAVDRRSLRLANRLVGNDETAAAVEVLLGGLAVRSEGRTTLAVTGALAPVSVNGVGASLYAPIDLRDGDLLALGMPSAGLRSYVAVRGGLQVPRVFGSASTDPTSGVGPPALRRGMRLAVDQPPARPADGVDSLGPAGPRVDDLVVRIVLGPRDDWFASSALNALTGSVWTVTSESDRVGIRLAGPCLDRVRSGELQSEGVVRGAVQVPASGQPLIFLADHPTTGGYPVIGVVLDEDTDALGQLRPGERLRLSVRRALW